MKIEQEFMKELRALTEGNPEVRARAVEIHRTQPMLTASECAARAKRSLQTEAGAEMMVPGSSLEAPKDDDQDKVDIGAGDAG